MRGTKSHTPKASVYLFTMIELMTVIGIIIIIAGILLPTLMRSKRTAQSVYCKNNLKQISLANLMYADTWERCIPWGADKNSTNLQRWFGRRKSDSNSAEYNHKLGPLYLYLKSEEIIKCPAFEVQASDPPPSVENGSNGYGYNFYVGTQAYFETNSTSSAYYSSGILIQNFNDPSNTVMFSDAAMNVDSAGNIQPNSSKGEVASYSITYAPFGVTNKTTDTNLVNDPSIFFLHERRANISWCDGHVDSQSMVWTPDNGWKKKKLGFFGTSSDNALFNPAY